MTSPVPSLGSPPEFRPDGGDPPVTSPPIVVLDRLAPVHIERPPGLRHTLGAWSLRPLGLRLDVNKYFELMMEWTELRRFRSSTFWEREPQTIQLAPGVSTERTVRLAVGLSREQTETFARAFQIRAKGDIKVIQTTIIQRWSESVGEKIGFETTREHTETLKLQNPNTDPDVYRRFAIWTVVHEYAVDRLDGVELTRQFEPDELEQLRAIPAIWTPVAPPVRVTASNTVVTSSIDVKRPPSVQSA